MIYTLHKILLGLYIQGVSDV